MSTLAQLGGSPTATLVQTQPNNALVEPLDGPTTVDDVMDRFPPEVYQQGRDTHLYRFLQALGGDAGVGLLKKYTSTLRLQFEAEFLNFHVLDNYYGAQFNLNRLASETYQFAVDGALTPEQWDTVFAADQSYRQRVAEFFTATREGNSPLGMQMAAQAGMGIEAEIVENYKYIFDQLADDQLGLKPAGTSASVYEFVVVPRFINLSDDIYDQGYEQSRAPVYTFTPANIPDTQRPALGGTLPSVTQSYSTEPVTKLLPSIERNTIDILDRLRSISTFASVLPEPTRFINVPVSGDPFASSQRLTVNRLVTGRADVPWPPTNPVGNYFIVGGSETEAGYYYGAQRDLPVVFDTIENIHAYTELALSDPTYGSNAFYTTVNGLAPFDLYRSEFVGNYPTTLQAIFPFLLNLSPTNFYQSGAAVAAQNTPLVLEGGAIPNANSISPDDILVNGMYPVSYFGLPGVDQIAYPDTFWWASLARFASVDGTGQAYQSSTDGGRPTSEVLEIDLGTTREVNYINFDVITAPLNISIEYDDISDPDRDAVWLPVKPMVDMPFDNYIVYDADTRTSWFNGEYNFTDSKGEMVHTRYLRITFTRRDDPWPTQTSGAFQWPVMAKHLRVGRFVANYLDTVGPLIVQDTPIDLTPITLPALDPFATREVRQRFVFPAGSERNDVVPNLLGFGVLVQTNYNTDGQSEISSPDVKFQWSLWDVTTPDAPQQLRNGVVDGVVNQGLSWLDFYLDESQVISGDLNTTYELRIASLTPQSANTVFTHSPNTFAVKTLPGTLDFTSGSTAVSTSDDLTGILAIGSFITNTGNNDQVYLVNALTSSSITINTGYDGASETGATGNIVYPFSQYNNAQSAYILDGTQNLVMRVWADVVDSGRDVLGNAYRYSSRRAEANAVLDPTKAGWMSAPSPSTDAVEALYFDVRSTDSDGKSAMSLIDAIRIAPRTPGVQMNVYFSQQGLDGEAPTDETDWDYLLWNPVQTSYTLRRREVIELPHQIRATFVKLEFTALRPMPFRVPTFPALPPQSYRVYPQWVVNQFSATNTQINTGPSPYLRPINTVQISALQNLTAPVQEYLYPQRSLMAQLALGTVANSQIVNANIQNVVGISRVDPTTAQKIFVNTPQQYQNSLLLAVDQESVLGKIVVGRFNPTLSTDPIEAQGIPSLLAAPGAAYVSTINNRVSQAYQTLSPAPMWFNQTCRHSYDILRAEFNKKAYFVGIDTVQFLRNDYTVAFDDALIEDNLHDDTMLETNTWALDGDTTIADGVKVYVSYQVGTELVRDEPVFLADFTPSQLGSIGTPATNVLVYSAQARLGNQYFQGIDYDLIYGTDPLGNRTTSIMRSPLGERLGVPLQVLIYTDASTVIGHAVIPSPPTDDASVVTGVAVIPVDVNEGPFTPNFGTGTFGGLSGGTGATFGDLSSAASDTATAKGVAVPSGETNDVGTDSGTVTGVAVISASESEI